MVDSPAHAETVSKSKRGVLTALVLFLVVVAALAVAYFSLGGDELVANLMGTGTPAQETETIPPKPATSSDATKSAETTPAATVPTAEADLMYWEQVASQEQIALLVSGDITGVSIQDVTKSGSAADVGITVTYKAGGTLSGTMVLRDYGGVWYFSSIARDGNPLSTSAPSPGDAGVVATILSQQAANQAIPLGIINGGYKVMTVSGTEQGSGTATIQIMLSGGTSAETAGTITCVSKTVNGEKLWFISSFAKK